MTGLFGMLLILIVNPFNSKADKLDSLKSVLRHLQNDTTKVNVLNKISRLSAYSNPHEAEQHANDALLLSRKLDFRAGESAALNNLGVCNSIQGQYDQALDFFKQSFDIDEKLNHKKDMASKNLKC